MKIQESYLYTLKDSKWLPFCAQQLHQYSKTNKETSMTEKTHPQELYQIETGKTRIDK